MANDVVFTILAKDEASKAINQASKAMTEIGVEAIKATAGMVKLAAAKQNTANKSTGLEKTIKNTNKQLVNASKTLKDAGSGARGFASAIRAPGAAVKDFGKGLKDTTDALEKFSKTMRDSIESAKNAAVNLGILGLSFNKTRGATIKLGTYLGGRFLRNAKKLNPPLLALVKSTGAFAAAGTAAAASAAALATVMVVKGVKSASDFHKELRDLGIQAGLTAEQFERMAEGNADWAQSVEDAYDRASQASDDWRIRNQEALAAASDDWEATTTWITDRWQDVKDFVGTGFEIGALSYGAVTGRANTETSNAAVARFAVEHGLTRQTAEMILRGTGAAPANAGGPGAEAYLTGGGAQIGSAAITPGGYVALNRLPPTPTEGGGAPASAYFGGPDRVPGQFGFGISQDDTSGLAAAFFNIVSEGYGLSTTDTANAISSGDIPELTPRPTLGGGGTDSAARLAERLAERSERAFARAFEDAGVRAVREAIDSADFTLAKEQAQALYELRSTAAQSLDTEGERYLAQQQADFDLQDTLKDIGDAEQSVLQDIKDAAEDSAREQLNIIAKLEEQTAVLKLRDRQAAMAARGQAANIVGGSLGEGSEAQMEFDRLVGEAETERDDALVSNLLTDQSDAQTAAFSDFFNQQFADDLVGIATDVQNRINTGELSNAPVPVYTPAPVQVELARSDLTVNVYVPPVPLGEQIEFVEQVVSDAARDGVLTVGRRR